MEINLQFKIYLVDKWWKLRKFSDFFLVELHQKLFPNGSQVWPVGGRSPPHKILATSLAVANDVAAIFVYLFLEFQRFRDISELPLQLHQWLRCGNCISPSDEAHFREKQNE